MYPVSSTLTLACNGHQLDPFNAVGIVLSTTFLFSRRLFCCCYCSSCSHTFISLNDTTATMSDDESMEEVEVEADVWTLERPLFCWCLFATTCTACVQRAGRARFFTVSHF